MESPQAILPTRRDSYSLQLDSMTTQRGIVVLPPRIVEADGIALNKVSRRMAFRSIQNIGTVAVKFLDDNNELATANNFHGILAAGTATDDGLGSLQSFAISGNQISIIGVGGVPRVCIYEAYAPL